MVLSSDLQSLANGLYHPYGQDVAYKDESPVLALLVSSYALHSDYICITIHKAPTVFKVDIKDMNYDACGQQAT